MSRDDWYCPLPPETHRQGRPYHRETVICPLGQVERVISLLSWHSWASLLGLPPTGSVNPNWEVTFVMWICIYVNLHSLLPMAWAMHSTQVKSLFTPNTLTRGMLQIPKIKLHLPSFDCIKTPVWGTAPEQCCLGVSLFEASKDQDFKKMNLLLPSVI